ncbi:MAG: PD-(D/E)XK nuclease family transposase [Bacteroidales bacterium]|nr:PD-(D/E)XK nuclease family transposase [Candidatus Scybalocola fimicaballi]
MCIPGTAMSRYINFYTDFAFKKIFGTEANKDLLISFLNALLEFDGGNEIVDLTYLNPEQLGNNISERRAIYDVYCLTKDGERFIVEMQNAKQDHFKDRSIYYSSFAIQEQGKKGSKEESWDYRLSPVYVVGILNFMMDESEENLEKVITKVKLKDDSNKDFSDKLNFIFIEMPKFRKDELELNSFIEKWLYVIKNLYRLQDKPSALTEGIFNKLFQIAEIAAYSKSERYDYEESLKNFRDMFNVISSAEKKAREEGEAIGERKTNIRNAQKLKQLGVDFKTISIATGLSAEEIERL